MLFNYKTLTKEGRPQAGSIEAPSVDIAINSLQKRGLIVVKVEPAEKKSPLVFRFFNRVKMKDIVMLSRQIATLFEAKVSVLNTFTLLANESENPTMRRSLIEIIDDIKGGVSISNAMAKHPDLFSTFYISMVKSGEETGKLSESFNYLADYLDRTYAVTSKAINALIYPAFVIISFVGVIIIMMMFVVPKLSIILAETGQELPIYTKAIIGISQFFVNFWFFIVVALVALGFFLWQYLPTAAGKVAFSRFKLAIPYIGDLYKKLYLSRLADNLDTMITSGVSMMRALEITGEVVDNEIYRGIMLESANAIKGGAAVSDAFARYHEIPGVMVQMIKVGEESGKLGYVLHTLAAFYRREVDSAVDTLVSLIEPVMIVILGLGVGVLLAAVLVPIYNLASAF